MTIKSYHKEGNVECMVQIEGKFIMISHTMCVQAVLRALPLGTFDLMILVFSSIDFRGSDPGRLSYHSLEALPGLAYIPNNSQ